MNTIYCRIITDTYSTAAEESVKEFLSQQLNALGISSVVFSSYIPYWKEPHQGELSAHFLTQISLETIQSQFADTWQADTADSRWSKIHCPHAVFLWISH